MILEYPPFLYGVLFEWLPLFIGQGWHIEEGTLINAGSIAHILAVSTLPYTYNHFGVLI